MPRRASRTVGCVTGRMSARWVRAPRHSGADLPESGQWVTLKVCQISRFGLSVPFGPWRSPNFAFNRGTLMCLRHSCWSTC